MKRTKHLENIMKKQEHCCFLCDQPLSWGDANKDHFFPKSLGGSDSYCNTVLTHKSCNYRKGNSLPSPAMVRKFASIFGTFPKDWKFFKPLVKASHNENASRQQPTN